jgi:hypothetical protein
MVRVLWIIGFIIAFLFYGSIGVCIVFFAIRHHHCTVRGAFDLALWGCVMWILWSGFRFIVLKRTE